MFSKVFVALTLASTAFATVFVTAPVASSTFSAGKENTIRWQESGEAPTLAEFGPARISIYAGNSQQQTLLQAIETNIDVSKESSVTFTPDASIGPNGSEYFIRFESLSLKDDKQPQFPALAFSAKFTLEGMTGVFNATVASQIAGQATAPLASVRPASTTASATSSATSKASTSASTSATSTPSSGAMAINAGFAGALLSALIGATMF
ncbi:hypothetical protein JR316_0013237 [Psilocybe cubensis]|uniref:Yeast cell wall synthesis Kre9/Knh1-like N-terminal domain-containing protein n=2 Tax=Psilocybe cubensis TaxID=181762 RepID=A0A8H7XUB8_PSICU|nr:hypothetical protein JR316_0013237 [Psilocybe cubensis]KAH9474772.1 hypothetical protein JR316_0013237 [Psilocybe cubensis]